MIGVWIFLLLFLVLLICYHIVILTKLVDFQLDQTSPIDLCIDLEKNVLPITVGQCSVTVLSLLVFRKGWPVFLLNIGSLAYLYHLKRRATQKSSQIFDPVTVVRDMFDIKVRHMAAAGICLVSAIYSLTVILISFFSK